jgi:type II secretory pathway component PulJ
MTRRSGFTLIEVMIASLLLFFLSYATYSSVRNTVQLKETVDQRIDKLQEARAVLAILDRDIRLATFSTPEDLVWDLKLKKLEEGQAPPVKPVPISIFKGSASEIFFSGNSHQRMSAESPENEQHFVTYQLTGDKLVRGESFRASSIQDRESPDKFHTLTLLENVKSLKFSYWDLRSDSYSDTWDSDKDEFKYRIPKAVKIELEFEPTQTESAQKRKVENTKLSTIVAITEAQFKTLLGVPGVQDPTQTTSSTTQTTPPESGGEQK